MTDDDDDADASANGWDAGSNWTSSRDDDGRTCRTCWDNWGSIRRRLIWYVSSKGGNASEEEHDASLSEEVHDDSWKEAVDGRSRRPDDDRHRRPWACCRRR